ncbi:hypothetical protein NsoK4_05140 [Nitrosopumilus sp. K4]|uniref:hypothetical protein n=1 Tax=Nitrosopumilus sp. K4 TaxID=2795383 RepID=UPI001BA5AF5D|nr:hypothetical protein [Nitrosopumilus sp. K4]QUC63856.1 hypothetical protein NsoK4_05140 [Nitrosopumilus sp. K4]
MDSPLSSGEDGINIKPEQMEKEKLYHCIFKDKILLVFKDFQDVLNCYEIEEKNLVDKVKNSKNIDVEKILEDYIQQQNLKNK